MIDNIIVAPRRYIASLIDSKETPPPAPEWFLISIFSATTGPLIAEKIHFELLAEKNCIDYQAYEFHDITQEQYDSYGRSFTRARNRFIVFSKKQAKDIVGYINKFKNFQNNITLVVHCEQGVSRSGAVGIFACRYLGLDEHSFRARHPNIRPNPTVYDTLRQVSGLPDTFERFWEKNDAIALHKFRGIFQNDIRFEGSHGMHNMYEP
jgi:predicted protein tyrosine phosphatase